MFLLARFHKLTPRSCKIKPTAHRRTSQHARTLRWRSPIRSSTPAHPSPLPAIQTSMVFSFNASPRKTNFISYKRKRIQGQASRQSISCTYKSLHSFPKLPSFNLKTSKGKNRGWGKENPNHLSSWTLKSWAILVYLWKLPTSANTVTLGFEWHGVWPGVPFLQL